jgi:hypothetical protein
MACLFLQGVPAGGDVVCGPDDDRDLPFPSRFFDMGRFLGP